MSRSSEENQVLIKRYLRISCIRRIFLPIIPTIIGIILLIEIPFFNIFFPTKINDINDIEKLYEEDNIYVSVDLVTIYYSGYDKYVTSSTAGAYYYNLNNSECSIILLDTDLIKSKSTIIHNYSIRAKLVKSDSLSEQMLSSLAKDLSWDYESLKSISSDIIIDQTSYHIIRYVILLAIIIILLAICLFIVFSNIIYIAFPLLHPVCRKLKKYYHGSSLSSVMAHAEQELEHNVIIQSADIYITKHYFVEITGRNVVLLPINTIVWVFKHSIWKAQLLKRHNKLTYNLIIIAKDNRKISLVSKEKNDLDKILSYLSNSDLNILIGYSKENKKLAKQLLNEK